MVRRNMEKIHLALTNMKTVLNGLSRGLELSILDSGSGEQFGTRLSFFPTTQALGLVMPSNSPAVNSLWLPAIALKTPVIIKPGKEEPWTPYRLIQWLPYLSHYFKATLEAVHEFLEDLLLYLPLGFLLARVLAQRTVRRSSQLALAAALLCAAWALLLEGLQLGLPRRYVDISDVVTAALAGVLGGFAWAWFAQLAGDALAGHRTSIILMTSDSPSETRFKK
jgi:VanZ family protein